jgi:hypothetical protein
MAEAITIIGLVAAIFQLGGHCRNASRKLKDAATGNNPETLLVQNILPLLLTSLRDLGERIEFGDVDDETQKAVSSAVEGMTVLVKELEELLDLYLISEAERPWKKWVKVVFGSLMGRDKRLKGILTDLRDYHSTLVFHQTIFIPRPITSSAGTPFMVPFPRDDNFIQRSGFIQQMRDILHSKGLVILAGIGGSG